MRTQQQQPTVIYILNADGTPLQPMSATAGAASARGLKSIKWPMVDGVVKSVHYGSRFMCYGLCVRVPRQCHHVSGYE